MTPLERLEEEEAVLREEGLHGWIVKRSSGGNITIYKEKTIILSPNASWAMFLHEVTHALLPAQNGAHHHSSIWADKFTEIVDRYPEPIF